MTINPKYDILPVLGACIVLEYLWKKIYQRNRDWFKGSMVFFVIWARRLQRVFSVWRSSHFILHKTQVDFHRHACLVRGCIHVEKEDSNPRSHKVKKTNCEQHSPWALSLKIWSAELHQVTAYSVILELIEVKKNYVLITWGYTVPLQCRLR